MAKVTIYTDASCGACAAVIPLVKRLAKQRKVRVTVVDVDTCHTETCNNIQYVPYITIGNHEATLEELKKVLGVNK